MTLLESQVDDSIVVANELNARFAEGRVEHHVGLGGLTFGAVLAIVVLGQCKRVF